MQQAASTSFLSKLQRWFPSPLLRASVLFQATGWPLAMSGAVTSPWLYQALLLNHLLVFAAGLRPQDTSLGPNLVRLPRSFQLVGTIALTFDDGPDPEVTPWVLETLDRHQVKASFFCIGQRARRERELIREIAARGHRVENHSDHHGTLFALQGPQAIYDELRRAQDTLSALTGRSPSYFRAPFGIRNPWVIPVLDRLDLRLVSWTRRGYDAVLGDAEKVSRLLLRNLSAGDILLLHDGSCARNRRGEPVVMQVLPRLLDEITRLGLHATLLPDGENAPAPPQAE